MQKNTLYILLFIALVVGAFGGYYYEKTKLMNQMTMWQADMQKQLDDEKSLNKQLTEKMPTPSIKVMKK